MAGNIIQVEYDSLKQIALQFKKEAEGIRQLNNSTRSQLSYLAGSEWRGLAADAFQNEMNGVALPALQHLEAALIETESKTLQIIQMFQTAEDDSRAFFKENSNSTGGVKKVRIYLINGIDWKGDESNLLALKQHLIDQYQGNAEVIIPDYHPYGETIAAQNWIKKYMPFLVSAGAAATVAGFVGILGGAGSVLRENIMGPGGPETQQMADRIKLDLAANPLLPGEELVFVGHSGGGAISTNLAQYFKQSGLPNNVGSVGMGSPLINSFGASAVGKVVQIYDPHDPIGIIGQMSTYSNPFQKNINLEGVMPSIWNLNMDDHGNYFSENVAQMIHNQFPVQAGAGN